MSYTFSDEQSVDRIAKSVRWTEQFTSRQGRRPDGIANASTFSSLMLGQAQENVATRGFGTALLYEGEAGSEVPGTEVVHYVNTTGTDLVIGDAIWLCWPRIDGDHSGEAEDYWYAVSGGAVSVQKSYATLNYGQNWTLTSTTFQVPLTKSTGTSDITVDGAGEVTIANVGVYLITYDVIVYSGADNMDTTKLPPPNSMQLYQTNARIEPSDRAQCEFEAIVYSGTDEFAAVGGDRRSTLSMPHYTFTGSTILDPAAADERFTLSLYIEDPAVFQFWPISVELSVYGVN